MELFLLPLLLLLLLQNTSISIAENNNECPSHCGPHPIPYPFGVGPNCSLPGFNLSCRHDRLFLSSLLLVLDISNGQLRVDSAPFVASDCSGGAHALSHISLPPAGPFSVSSSGNRLVAAGCDTVAVVSGADGRSSSGGCVSLCTAAGFCEAALPERQRRLGIGVGNMFGYENVTGEDNCSFAIVAEREERMGGEMWREVGRKRREVAMILDWEITSYNGAMCSECGENGYCVESTFNGYLCYCMLGFDGNPYLHGSKGCQGDRY